MNKLGSIEYEQNEGKAKHIARYRRLARLEEDAPITEENLNDRVIRKVCNEFYRDYDQIRCELLGKNYFEEK